MDNLIQLAGLDKAIIAAYFVFVAGLAVWVAKNTKTDEDLFLAGRSLLWPVVGFSLFASNISTSSLVGLTGEAYVTGIAVSAYEWMAGLVLVFSAIFFFPIFLRNRITTIPEFLEMRFDRRSRRYFSALTIFTSVIVDTAVSLYAAALAIQTFFPSADILNTIMFIGVFTGIYTAFGGLRAVAFTDVLQAIILLLGSFLILYFVFGEYNFSWAAVKADMPEGHLNLMQPMDHPVLPWLGVVTGVPILGFWYWTTNQYVVQRVLGSKNIYHARLGSMFAGMLKILPLFIMVIPGAMAYKLIPDLQNKDMVFAALVRDYLPIGATGIVMAALLSAVMSSVSSTLNSASTLVVHDFIVRDGVNLSNKRITNYGRLTTLVLMIVAVLWAPQVGGFEGIINYIQKVFSLLVPPIVAIFIMGVFYKKGSGTASIATLALGHLFGILLFFLGLHELWNIHYTINVPIILAFSIAVFMIVSKLSPAPSEQCVIDVNPKELLHDAMKLDAGKTWLTSWQLYAVITVASILATWIFFW